MRTLFDHRAALAALALAAACGPAAAVTLTFDELPTQTVQGLTFSGIQFGFTVGGLASSDAAYNRPGPPGLSVVQGAVLEADANGVLTLGFATPTPVLDFGLALTSTTSLAPGATVALFDAALQPLRTVALDAPVLDGFAQGRFAYAGAPLGRAVIDFNEAFGGAVRRVALDNLRVEPATGGTPGQPPSAVPVPSVAALMGIGLAGLAGLGRRSAAKR